VRGIAKSVRAGGTQLVLAAVALAWPTFAAGSAIPANLDTPARPAFVAPMPLAGKHQANFFGERASSIARRVADWAVASGDNGGLPFAIVDKIGAKVFVFDNVGRLRGATFALLGKARGDNSIPGIGSRKLSSITADERTTPAGRFVASLGRDLEQDVLWIDYGDSVSMHRVVRGDPGDHRLQRLATTSALDKRITYGCINVPVKFYEEVVRKTFTGTNGIVYILPEAVAIRNVFSLTDVEGEPATGESEEGAQDRSR
jgi:hypothetical protein